MDIEIVYLVEISSGSYEDYRTNTFRVYKSEEDAKKFINKYNIILAKLIKFYNEWCEKNPYQNKENEWHG